MTCNALYGALGVIAGSQATMNNFVWGNDDFQNYETIAGGTGAGHGFDGCDAVQSHMTNTRMTDPEVLEKRFPVRLEAFTIRSNSGGAGQWRGGHGVFRTMRFTEPVTVTTLSNHRIIPPFGGDGVSPEKLGATGSRCRTARCVKWQAMTRSTFRRARFSAWRHPAEEVGENPLHEGTGRGIV